MALTVYGSPYVDGTDLVANWPAASLTVAQSIDSAGYYIGRGNNTQTGSYTTVLTDAGKTITMSNASANTVTIPANSSVAYVIGSRINILNLGAGACTPTAAAGVTIAGTITALATNQAASVIKTATNTWSYVPFSSGGAATLTSGDVTSTTGSPTITPSGGFTIYTFTGSGTMVLGQAGICTALLTISGGGGGGGAGSTAQDASGGGAGSFIAQTSFYLPAGTLTFTIGAGGAGGGSGRTRGTSGTATSFGSLILGVGGGAGDYSQGAGGNAGGSGGGPLTVTLNNNFGTGLYGGNNGAASTGFGRGGGGSGGAGSGATGGVGTSNSITGSPVTYAVGGNGAAAAVPGGANTGTAGTGGITSGAAGAAGGSGVIIVKVVT